MYIARELAISGTCNKRSGSFFFNVHDSLHHKSILIIVQQDATVCSLFILLQDHSTCFGCLRHPSSGVRETGTTASGTGRNVGAATSFQRCQFRSGQFHVLLMMGAVDTRNT